MPEAKILSFERGAGARRQLRELAEWRARLRLAFERDWDWRARDICRQEIRRLSDLLHAEERETA